ncbi:hypothetical protein B0T17DRAFT_612366 [Bombardia bombarda]|uniref:Uncharacterized protein n=1 Tax=Bombardia bombarda TaxID=252184 RepID=A0AA40CEP4_9PEZI|nr:hypothetical protein B0T17DRAFT_612366 [Bombardia bombarda]
MRRIRRLGTAAGVGASTSANANANASSGHIITGNGQRAAARTIAVPITPKLETRATDSLDDQVYSSENLSPFPGDRGSIEARREEPEG